MISSLIASLALALDSLLGVSSVAATADVGIMVYDLTSDTCLYEHNARHTMRPASTQKLVTGITALDNLGSDYIYTTSLCYTGSIDTTYVFCPEDSVMKLRRGSLCGDLYIIGAMDPKLDSEDLDMLAGRIYEMGIDTIAGSLFGDRSFMSGDKYGQGWCWDDDNPELSALLFNRKDALLPQFAMALHKAGIVVLGNITEQACPSTALWLTSVTHSLPEILEKVMKNSNNAYAETLLYHLGATQGRPSTAKKGIAVEETLLKKIYSQQSDSLSYPWTGRNRVPPHRFADGSGLSLYNYVSPEMEVAYLHYAYTHYNIFPYLYDALPIAGIDGTLEQRMTNTSAKHNVRAKTGTLTGVISLAGYCKTSGEHALAFSIIINGCLNAEQARNLQDKICAILCN